MTTQPEMAVGSVAAPEGTASEPTAEERLAAHAHAFEEQEEEDTAEPEDSDQLETGDDDDLEADEGDEPELPPIKAPASWTAEEQAAFAELPRSMQETVTRREAEREKFVQAKSQEAARVKAEVENQALAEVQALAQNYAQRVQSFLPQIPEKPSAWLQVNDPLAYAEQQDAYDWAIAQHQMVQQELEQASTLAQTAAQEHARRTNAANVAILSEQFPEYLDPQQGVEHRKVLGTLAMELGFTADELAEPDARDILALRKVAELKTKADKYDKLMAGRMENVRRGKQLPKVSRPGQAQPQGAASARRLESDRNAMRSGDMDAAARVFGRHLK